MGIKRMNNIHKQTESSMLFNFYDKVAIRLTAIDDRYFKAFQFHLKFFYTDKQISDGIRRVQVEEGKGKQAEASFDDFGYGKSFITYRDTISGKQCCISTDCEKRIIFESGFDPISLIMITDLVIRDEMVEEGMVFLHSAAIVIGGCCVLVPGWGGIGKTTLILYFLSAGAKYLAEDFVLVDESGKVFPNPRPLNLMDYNFEDNPDLLLPVASSGVRRYYYWNKYFRVWCKWLEEFPLLSRIIEKIQFRLQCRVHEYISVEKIFQSNEIEMQKAQNNALVLHLIRSKNAVIEELSVTAGWLATRMEQCLLRERRVFFDYHNVLLYSFPEQHERISRIIQREREILESFFKKSKSVSMVRIGNDQEKIKTWIVNRINTENSK